MTANEIRVIKVYTNFIAKINSSVFQCGNPFMIIWSCSLLPCAKSQEVAVLAF